MNPRKGLVLDANILMRAVLGRRVRELLEAYEDAIRFYSLDVCFATIRTHLALPGRLRGGRATRLSQGRASFDQAL